MLFTGGRRHYACSTECRTRILSGVRSVRLGQLLDPSYPVEETQDAENDADDALSLPMRTPAPSAVATPAPPTVAAMAAANAAAAAATPIPPLASVSELRPLPRAADNAARPRTAAGSSMPRILAVFNHKGGTGKTTSAVHVAAGLAARGAKVLLVDADGQGNVGASLGLEAERSLYHVLVMGLPF